MNKKNSEEQRDNRLDQKELTRSGVRIIRIRQR